MARLPPKNRIPIMMSDEELAAVDAWRVANGIATRSDAIRCLCRIGLQLVDPDAAQDARS
jgi:metal-responsive CopG/Arc/MetJ family transcriptional regulator